VTPMVNQFNKVT